VLLLNECLLFLFISLSTQSGNVWIHPRIWKVMSAEILTSSLLRFLNDAVSHTKEVCDILRWYVLSGRTRSGRGLF
jgi:hypothetical protein